MLLLEPPDQGRLLRIIDDVASGRVSRLAALTWHLGLVDREGYRPGSSDDLPLTVRSGYWYFWSLGLLTHGYAGQPFLRAADLEEYRLDLTETPAHEACAGVSTRRVHQLDMDAVRWPMAVAWAPLTHFPERGLTPVRGVFEAHLDPLEHLHLQFEGIDYLCVRQFDREPEEVMILATSREREPLRELLQTLKLDATMMPV